MKRVFLLLLISVIAMMANGEDLAGIPIGGVGAPMPTPNPPVFYPFSLMGKPGQLYPYWEPMYQETPYGYNIPTWNNQPMGSPGLPASG